MFYKKSLFFLGIQYYPEQLVTEEFSSAELQLLLFFELTIVRTVCRV